MTAPGGIIQTVLLLAALAPATACSSPEGNIERIRRTVRSWDATTRSTSEALARGAVPRVYARQVLRAAIDNKRQLTEDPEWHSLPEDARGRLDAAIRELASSLDEPADALPRR